MACTRVAAGRLPCAEVTDFPGDWCSSCLELLAPAMGAVCPECRTFLGEELDEGSLHEEFCSHYEEVTTSEH